jgi:hypothetical protein
MENIHGQETISRAKTTILWSHYCGGGRSTARYNIAYILAELLEASVDEASLY